MKKVIKNNRLNMSLASDWDWHNSRKYRTAWKLTLMFTMMFVLPPIAGLVLSLIFGGDIEFSLLTPSLYTTFIGAIWGVYFGVNITEKLKFFTPKQQAPADFTKEIVEDIGTNSGGQPQESIGNEP